MDIVRIVLAVLLTATGGGKLAGAASSHTIRDSLAVPARAWRAIGAFEILVVIGLVAGIWLRPLGIVATAGVVVLMIGAIASRVRAGGRQRNSGVAADAVILIIAVIATVIAL